MIKKWKQSELNRIYRDHPELKPLPVKSLDTVVIEFLKLHEVEVMPPKNSRAGGAIAGAITGAFGPDVGGDAFLIQGQNKQTKLQEWTSWKQWALSHKDFPEFKKKLTGGAVEKNEEIERNLYEPEFVKKWTAYFKEYEAKEYERKTKENRKQSASICVAPRFRCFSFVLCVLSCVRSFFCGCEIVAKVVQTLKLSLLCGRVLFARFLSLFFAFYYLFFSRFLISLFRIAVSSSVPSIFA